MRSSLVLGMSVVLLQPTAALMTSALLRPAANLRTLISSVARSSKISAYDGGWTTCIDPSSGSTYYYNEQTGQSQWDPPFAETPEEDEPPKVFWQLASFSGVAGFDFTQEGKHYNSWGLHAAAAAEPLPYALCAGDKQVLSRWNMVNQKLTVSRKQAKVECLGDGTATLTSVGKGPTLWRGQQSGGGWVALYQGDKVALSHGDHISLDCNDPDAAVFICESEDAMEQQGGQQGGYVHVQQQDLQQQQGYMQQDGYLQQDAYAQQQNLYAQQQDPYAVQPQGLPAGWVTGVDQESGATYYFNELTGMSSWDPPQ